MPQSSPSRLERGGRVVRHRGSAFDVARLPKGEREHQLREAALPWCRSGRGKRDRAFAGRERGVEIELFGCDVAEVGELLDPQFDRSVIVGGREGELEEAPSLGDAVGQREVPPQRAEPNRDRRVGRVASVRQRSPEIVVLQLEAQFPAQPFRPAQLDARLVGQRREVFGVRAAGGGEPAALGETLEHVLADRVEHVVAGGAARERGRHDRLVDQRGNEIRDGRLVEAVPRCERDERRQGRAAAVDGKLLEQRLLVPVQEVVAPFHEPLQRRAARVGGRAVTQERRAPLEDGDELPEPEHVHARGGELDRERQAVHPPDDLGGERDGLGVRLESGSCRARTLEEELDGRGRERRHGESHLARDVKRLAARRQDPRLRTLREDRRRDPRRLVEHVLARVENEESRRVAKP